MEKEKKWRKILYKEQPFDDNYADEEGFLKDLIMNANIIPLKFLELVRGSITISCQISLVILYSLAFYVTLYEKISSNTILILEAVSTILGFIVIAIAKKNEPNFRNFIFGSIKSIALLIGTLYTLTPLLITLTNSISDDTVTAMVILLTLLHLFSYDYSKNYSESKPKFQPPISINAAICASLLMGSRLKSHGQLFGLIYLSIQIFIFLPIIKSYFQRSSIESVICVTSSLVDCALLFYISWLFPVLYLSCIVVVTFVSPYWFIVIQKYKAEYNGPWDEAELNLQN
eukprot:TRINITY_DN17332_c0_g1_i1.p1 TRINITY_DN17332_c0_g1~~TRINITY_DN17332_c0_g1_i1.p1  ORF type:complete len:296 (+),score=57.41 TRINITY_DN17332_c0_g1_i1:28-888(+)